VEERTAELLQANQTLQAENAARRQVELRLREQAELIDKASEAILTTDLGHHIKFCNPAAERLFGWTAAELKGRPLRDVFAFSSGDRDLKVGTILSATSDWRGEIRGYDRKGKALTIETSITVLRDEAGRPVGKLSISSDITEKKKTEEKILRAQRLDSIGMLAAGISHDLNNVLAPIGMASALLRRRLSAAGDLRMLDILEKSVTRGSGLVRQILGFAHGISGEPRMLQVKHLLRDVTAIIRETFPKSIVLDEKVPNDLWPISGNPTQIHQVLINLCVNARDAMPEGGTLRLYAENCVLNAETAQAIHEAKPGSWVVLQVADTGTGIPPEVLSHLWEPFFTTKAANQGTGLGLSTVRGIVVENHHGFIDLQTKVGQGTTLRVYLPAVESEIIESDVTAAKDPGRARGESVLVVDDEENIRETIRELLSNVGYRIVLAGDGLAAAEIIKTRGAEFALVISDYDMPGLNGRGLTRIIRTHHPMMKILAISGFARIRRDLVEAGEVLDDEFLHKPFAAEALLESVERLLHGKALAAQETADARLPT
jgi:PAS domain S-box-containing protein